MVSVLKFLTYRNTLKATRLLGLSFLAVIALGTVPHHENRACANGTPNNAPIDLQPVCDPTFMTAMKTKAWMEAQREFMIAQSTIAKPDSVFALGCFGSFEDAFEVNFSDGTQYDLSGRVNNFVGAAFAHPYGGGHLQGAGSNNGMSTACGLMLQIWNQARCTQAAQDNPANVRTLLESSTFDRGAYPQACPTTGTWAARLDLFRKKAPKLSVGAAYDDMNIFLKITAPRSEAGACAAGIQTGLLFPGTNTKELVCPNPGCMAKDATCVEVGSGGATPAPADTTPAPTDTTPAPTDTTPAPAPEDPAMQAP